MKLNKDKVILGRQDELLHWIVIVALTETLKDKDFEEFLDKTDWQNKDEVDIQFLVEGKELDIEKVCERWQDQVDKMINEKAVELINEKFTPVQDFLYNIEKEVKRRAKDNLGLEPDDYDY